MRPILRMASIVAAMAVPLAYWGLGPETASQAGPGLAEVAATADAGPATPQSRPAIRLAQSVVACRAECGRERDKCAAECRILYGDTIHTGGCIEGCNARRTFCRANCK